MLTLLIALATQTGRTAITDTIAGIVTGPGGRPLAGAIVQATSAVTRLSRWQTSDAAGDRALPQLSPRTLGVPPPPRSGPRRCDATAGTLRRGGPRRPPASRRPAPSPSSQAPRLDAVYRSVHGL